MASFDSINYSLRPNKQIERGLAFAGVGQLRSSINLADQVYVGFGSIWFSDFKMAHRLLGIDDMRSFEHNAIGYSRASFNLPYRTVEVLPETSSIGLPIILSDARINTRPWLIWLDYDKALDEAMVDDIRLLIEQAPTNSMLLVTFSATANAYGRLKQRTQRLKMLLGDIVPDELSDDRVEKDSLAETLADLVLPFMAGIAGDVARPGGFEPAFRMIYTDSVTMITVGGMLPAPGAVPGVRETVRSAGWPCLVNMRIEAPHLTLKETVALQTKLPSRRPVTRIQVQRLGFDLEEGQIASFQKFYRFYPSFAEIAV